MPASQVQKPLDTPDSQPEGLPKVQIAALGQEKEMTAPHFNQPPIPTSLIPRKPNDFSRGAVTLLRRTLRQIESWQCALKAGKGNLVQESMAEAGCDIDDYLDLIDRGEG